MRGGMINTNAIDDDTRLDRAAAGQVLRRLGRLLRPYRAQIIVATVVLIAQTACLLAGPALVRAGVDQGLLAGGRRRAQPHLHHVPDRRGPRARPRPARDLARQPDR